MKRPSAFLFLGGFRVLCRNWRYLSEIHRRGMVSLFITSDGWRETTQRCMANPSHPASAIQDAAFVQGRVEIEGAFTPGVVTAARQWLRDYDIVGVYAVGEMMVEQTGVVADLLGLPSPGLRATRACRSKYLQRAYCPEWSPPSLIYSAGQHATPIGQRPGWPAVLKPASRRSSSGVQRIGSQADLDRCLATYPLEETLLLEEYVPGQEYSVEALVQQGRIVFESLTHKETSESGSRWFVELAHTVPSPPDSGDERLLAANRHILSRLDFADGIAHAEYRLSPDGEVYLMEIAARTPGDGLLPLYHLATGSPMEPEILRIALGEPASYGPILRFTRQVYVQHEPGVLKDVVLAWPGQAPVWAAEGEAWPPIRPGRLDDEPTLRHVVVLKRRDTRLTELRESDDRVLTFLMDAAAPKDLDELESRVRQAIDIQVASV